jgi:predicted membrane protein
MPRGAGPFGTTGFGINPAGVIAGDYADASFVFHGFVRAANGTIITFDAPGAGTGPGQGTSAFGINPAGVIEGQYTDASNVPHGFVRDANGAITAFDVPGAGTGPFHGSFVFSEAINHAGAIAGAYFDSSNVVHGFLRTP